MKIFDLLAFVCSIVGSSGIIAGIVLRRIDKLQKMIETREDDRVREMVMSGEALEATAKLAEANTSELRDITEDDVCEEELTEVKGAFEKLEHFMREKTARYLQAN